MGMEEVYTVRVKWKPGKEDLYPSERVYSSSTVGGLAIAHWALAVLSASLSALGYSVQDWRGEVWAGACLSLGAGGAGAGGLVGWRRWWAEGAAAWAGGGAAAGALGAILCLSVLAASAAAASQLRAHLLAAALVEAGAAFASAAVAWRGIRPRSASVQRTSPPPPPRPDLLPPPDPALPLPESRLEWKQRIERFLGSSPTSGGESPIPTEEKTIPYHI